MLLTNLFTYQINSKTEATVSATIAINAAHEIFNGHFPGVPVLPGVCQVQAIKEIMEEVLGTSLQYDNVRDIKFAGMVLPDKMQKLDCSIDYSVVDNGYKLSASLMFSQQSILKLRGNLVLK